MLSDVKMYEHSRAAVTAAINSSLGNECVLMGATLAFDITMCELDPNWKYAAAPYALELASAKTCRVASASCNVVMHLQGYGNVVAWIISLAMALQTA